MRVIDGVSTGMAVIQVEEAGQNTIAVCAGANAALVGCRASMPLYCPILPEDEEITLLQREVPHEANLHVAKTTPLRLAAMFA